MQRFITNSTWDEEQMLTMAWNRISEVLSAPNGMLALDSSEMPKKGKESVGVARQYCGNSGKIDNCQSGVFLAYVSAKGFGLVHRRLFLPEQWFSDAYQERRRRCDIPEDSTFQPKTEIGIDLLRQVLSSGQFLTRWVGMDSWFGRSRAVREAVASEGLYYFADVPKSYQVWTERPAMKVPPYRGQGRPPTKAIASVAPRTVADIALDPDTAWEPVIFGEGSKGPIYGEVACLRVIDCHEGRPQEECWLILRRLQKEIKYAICNAPPDCAQEELFEASQMRWPIEQLFQGGKEEIGMDHYEIRTWRAWHRHMTYIIIALQFLLEVQLTFQKKGALVRS